MHFIRFTPTKKYVTISNGDDMDYKIDNIDCLDLAETLDCGQAFRWRENPDGTWFGIAYGKELTLSLNEGTLTLFNTTEQEYYDIWENYFDIKRDYKGIENLLKNDKTLTKMYTLSRGVRVLNQEPWETLCSFIISQNNNIKRIKSIIERLCENFGEKLCHGYAFPTADTVAKLSVEDLSPLRCGFRAKYIIDAAQRVNSGEINFNTLRQCDIITARKKLCTIYGVGEKVADCTLLFSLGFAEAFPKDVWIKRAMPLLFPTGLPKECAGIEGIIQQYIFSYARKTKLEI